MRILYLCAYMSPQEHELRFGWPSHGVAPNPKVECIVAALSRMGHGVTVLSSASHSGWPPRVLRERTEVTAHTAIPFTVIHPKLLCWPRVGGAARLLSARRVAVATAEKTRPDVILCYNTYAFEGLAAAAVAKRFRIPMILEIEDLPLCRTTEFWNPKPALDSLFWDSTVELASAYTAVNETVLTKLPGGRPSFLFPGVLDERLLATERDQRPFAGERRLLGYFGALSYAKGCEVLLDAAPYLPSEWSLLITGSGPLSGAFERLSRLRPDKVKFLGSLPKAELYRAMRSVDATVIPPEKLRGNSAGVFPFKMCEYLVAGSHVISAHPATGGGVDLSFVRRWDGSTKGLLEQLGRAKDSYESEGIMRRRAAEHILSEYSMAAVSAKLEALLRAITPSAPHRQSRSKGQPVPC